MPEVWIAAKQGRRELPDGHPHKGGAVFFKRLVAPTSPAQSTPPVAEPSEAPNGDMSDLEVAAPKMPARS